MKIYRSIPLWRYNKDDKSIEKPSWKYIDHVRVTTRYSIPSAIWVKNPNFKYENLSPYDKNDITLDEYNLKFKKNKKYRWEKVNAST